MKIFLENICIEQRAKPYQAKWIPLNFVILNFFAKQTKTQNQQKKTRYFQLFCVTKLWTGIPLDAMLWCCDFNFYAKIGPIGTNKNILCTIMINFVSNLINKIAIFKHEQFVSFLCRESYLLCWEIADSFNEAFIEKYCPLFDLLYKRE